MHLQNLTSQVENINQSVIPDMDNFFFYNTSQMSNKQKRKSVEIDDSHSVSCIRLGTAKNVCDTSG